MYVCVTAAQDPKLTERSHSVGAEAVANAVVGNALEITYHVVRESKRNGKGKELCTL